MKKINVLDKKITELIAAGEIIERPASVVKELVENSIDAGSTKISIEIKYGGIKYIKVVDNGCGILRDDIKDAFLPHATSKIHSETDLEKINTLGFRGEALASIAAISKVRLRTLAENEKIGSCYEINFSNKPSFSECGHPKGTAFEINDLFFNTPARMKFLKSCAKEGQNICNIVEKMALSHPEISFKFCRDNKNIFVTPGDKSFKSVIVTIFGKEFFESLLPVKYEYKYIKIEGFVGIPESGKSNRSSQYFFINGRYIKTKTGSSALDEAYREEILHGKFPIAIIHISLSPEVLDVNVHPAKTEVKFFDEKIIFNSIFYAAKSALSQNKHRTFPLSLQKNLQSTEINPMDCSSNIKPITEQNGQTKFNSYPIKTLEDKEKIKDYILSDSSNNLNQINFSNNSQNDYTANLNDHKINNTENSNYRTENYTLINDQKNNEKIKIIGEVFETYIVGQLKNKMILIDKHAAHERLIFEQLKDSIEFKKPNSQFLAEPISINMTSEEHFSIITNTHYLEKIGFKIEDFGENMVIVRAAPTYLDYQKIKQEIIEIADYIIDNKKNLETNFVSWLQKNIACRSAIKAGVSSNYTEILNLVEKLQNNPELAYCPHGRPIYITWDKNFFKKLFFRT